jgi:OOP family OmpA-OmpF porin
MTRLASWSLVALGLLAPTVAAAQEQPAPAPLELGGFAGWHVFADDVDLGRRDDGVPVGARVGYHFGPRLAVEGEVSFVVQQIVGYRGSVLIEPHRRVFVLAGGTGQTVAKSGGATEPYLHLGFGGRVPLGERWGLRVQALGLTGDFGSFDVEVSGGVYLTIGGGSTPKAPPPPPPPPPDTDGDGVIDELDADPRHAEDMDGFQDDDGAPDPDNDGDGVPDDTDADRGAAEDKDGFQDDDGAPDPDNDGDGVLDGADAAPDEAEDRDGFQDEDGAPDPDNDGDGVLDTADRCHGEAETPNAYRDDDGCADEVPPEVQKALGPLRGVAFARGQVTLPRSVRSLDALASLMAAHAELKVEIVVVASAKGEKLDDDAALEALTQQRAEAIVRYLAGQGIDPARLRARGAGRADRAGVEVRLAP